MSHENDYKMTRDDVMRELELLPVWVLRAPLPAQLATKLRQPVTGEPDAVTPANTVDEEQAVFEQVFINQVNSDTPETIASPAILITSDDKKWAFVLPAELSGQAADLFNNILRALHINKTQTSHTQQLMQAFVTLDASVIVGMGEAIAQQLLASTQTIENLRGKMHLVQGAKVIVTYHPNELLQHLPNKAKTWDDLCYALSATSI